MWNSRKEIIRDLKIIRFWSVSSLKQKFIEIHFSGPDAMYRDKHISTFHFQSVYRGQAVFQSEMSS